MAEDTGETPTQEAQPAGDEAPPAESKSVPLAELLREREKRQAIEARIAEIETADAERKRKQAEEDGRWQELATTAQAELDEIKSKLTTFEQREAERQEAQAARQSERIDALPDNLKALVPEGIGGDALDGHLSRLEAMTAQPAGPTGTGGRISTDGGDPNALTDAERRWAETQSWLDTKRLDPGVIKRAYKKSLNW